MPDKAPESHKIQRRQFIRTVAGGVIGVAAGGSGLLTLAGCGADGAMNPSADLALPPVLKSNVVTLPGDGSVTLTSITGSSITLSGNVPPLAPGSVVISGANDGLVRKVVSLSQNAAETVVVTAPATLEDVFQEATISFTKSFTPSDFTSSRGVTPLKSRVPGTAGVDQRGRAFEFTIHFESSLATLGSAAFSVSGDYDFNLDLDTHIHIDWRGLESARCILTVDVQHTTTYKSALSTSVDLKVPISPMLVAEPIAVPILGVPVVFVPELQIFSRAQGSVEVGVEAVYTSSSKMAGGLILQRGKDPQTVHNLTRDGHIHPTSDGYSEVKIDLTPFRPELAMKIYGLSGPYVYLDLPKVEVDIKRTISPPATELDVLEIVEGSLGFKVEALSRTFVDVDLPGSIQIKNLLFHEIDPDNGQLSVGLQ